MTTLVTVDEEDYLLGFNFALEVSGKVVGFFTEVSGVGSENEIVEAGQVGKAGQQIVRKVPGRLKWSDITLKRGVTSSMDFWKWSEDVTNGKIDDNRFNGSIHLFSQDGSPIAQWDFEKAWLKDVSVPQFKSDGSDVAMEEVVFSHEYIKRIN